MENKEAQTERRTKAQADVAWMKEEVQQQLDEEQDRQRRFEQLYRDEAQRMFAKQEAVWDREKLMRKKMNGWLFAVSAQHITSLM